MIPNYEGDPLSHSLANQIKAAGAETDSNGDIILLTNNFDGPSQISATKQANDTLTNFSKFDSSVCSENDKVIGFIDNKYSNGADLSFVKYLLDITLKCGKNISRWAYAGWNTNGNTVGTVISNAVILSTMISQRKIRYFTSEKFNKYCDFCTPCERGDFSCANSYFNLLRILEDRDWQAILRQKMISYIEEVPDNSFNRLDSDMDFYKKYFRVGESEVISRLKASVTLPPTEDFIERTDRKPDFYGPFWVLSTIVLLLGIVGNLSNEILSIFSNFEV